MEENPSKALGSQLLLSGFIDTASEIDGGMLLPQSLLLSALVETTAVLLALSTNHAWQRQRGVWSTWGAGSVTCSLLLSSALDTQFDFFLSIIRLLKIFTATRGHYHRRCHRLLLYCLCHLCRLKHLTVGHLCLKQSEARTPLPLTIQHLFLPCSRDSYVTYRWCEPAST